MIKKIRIVLLCVCLLSPEIVNARPIAYDFSENTPQNAAFHSLILPGWGQSFNGQKTKGYILGGAVFLSVLTSYYYYQKADKTYDDYQKFGLINGSLYNDYETQQNQAMIVSFVAAGFWAYSIFDAYLVANGKQGYMQSYKREGMNLSYHGGRINLAYTKHF
jgi:hypothetical protein